MPTQIGAHAEALKHAGLELDPSVLTDPTSFPLGAIVSLGGCSASFVSNEGLIITNHHCVGRYLQSNSTPESNLLENGFLANTRAEEKSGGPRARVFVTQAFTDVTDKVLGGLDKVTDDKERYKTIAERRKQLINTCEQDRPDTRCLVSSFFEGAQFFQIEQLEIRDVRLVYAPHPGIGVYGGEIDNWRWPRHTGDFSFLRAYVGKDGKPADFAADNIPYTPPHHLKVASEKTKAGDFVMVAGYPGRTTRLKTAGEVREAADWTYNYRIQMYEEYIAVLKQLSELDPELKIKAAGRLRGLSNYYTNFKGMRDGLNQGGLASEKEKLEGELQTWINADQARKAKYGDVLAKIGELNAQRKQTRESDAAFSGILRGSSLLGTALDLLKWADQREKPDAERKRGYQEKDVADDVVAYESMQKTYDPRLDRAVFKLFLTRAAKLPEDKRPSILAAVVGKTVDEAAIDKALDKLYKKTKLGDSKVRVKLLKSASNKTLARSRDPFIKLALAIKADVDAMNARDEAFSGAMAALRPTYVAALRELAGGNLSPDANSTLRITYGTVRGYTPPGKSEPYVPFTTVSELVAKHTGEEPFNAPKGVLEVANTKNWGPYAHADMGEVTVNFLADLDITGGNSGSATLNARGELTGLVFDGNYESIASDWVFTPAVTRSIHLDIRYALWIMDAVDKADHLLTEMGVTPAID